MSALTVYPDNDPTNGNTYLDFSDIQAQLEPLNIRFERWSAGFELTDDADQDVILQAYRQPIDRLQEEYGFQSVDVIGISPNHPEKEALRQKFLSEHIHDDFEVRFFIEGRGLFSLHVDDKVYCILCEQGDLISVPAGAKHWFDMGQNPNFRCIRLFTTPDGWVANFTGSNISEQFPSFDDYIQQLD
ncbi:MAG: cupin [Gammaproteobacteria bacterium]|nr:cupin [Gammaproteobacteria bacterium]